MTNTTHGRTVMLKPDLAKGDVLPLLLALLLALPLATILVLAVASMGEVHLPFGQLRGLAMNTALLCFFAALLAFIIGTLSAWLVAAYDFPGRNLLSWMALLPLAMPGYIIAFVFVDFFDYAGGLQTWMRQSMGWSKPGDYWFPEIRSLGGAAVSFALVLYPYVYMAGRSAFARMPASQVMSARTLGHGSFSTFLTIVFPQARPALVVGVVLVVMECLNDIGSVSFFGIRTFAVAIYSTWLDQGSLGGAAQLSVIMLVAILIGVGTEYLARKKDRLAKSSSQGQRLAREQLNAGKAWLATLIVGLPVLIGFFLPVVLLIILGLRRFAESATEAFGLALFHTVILALAAALLTLIAALVINHGQRNATSVVQRTSRFLANLGYAIPGTILAIGIMVPLGRVDHGLNTLAQSTFGFSTGLILSGTVFAVLFAYVVRFLIIASSMVDTGLEKIPQSLGHASRVLGRTPFRTFLEVHLPLLRPSLVAGGLLVFVDAMKELPATLLLRPFDYDTLATLTFATASLGQIEQAALPALAIVAAGLIPVYVLMVLLHGPGD
jgi:iron(III) transport system permease protein